MNLSESSLRYQFMQRRQITTHVMFSSEQDEGGRKDAQLHSLRRRVAWGTFTRAEIIIMRLFGETTKIQRHSDHNYGKTKVKVPDIILQGGRRASRKINPHPRPSKILQCRLNLFVNRLLPKTKANRLQRCNRLALHVCRSPSRLNHILKFF
jgi:hypothetical protein